MNRFEFNLLIIAGAAQTKQQSQTRARDPSVEGNEDSGIIQMRKASDWSLTPYRIY